MVFNAVVINFPTSTFFKILSIMQSVLLSAPSVAFSAQSNAPTSRRLGFLRDMSCLGDEIDMFSWLKRNVWLLYTIFTV